MPTVAGDVLGDAALLLDLDGTATGRELGHEPIRDTDDLPRRVAVPNELVFVGQHDCITPVLIDQSREWINMWAIRNKKPVPFKLRVKQPRRIRKETPRQVSRGLFETETRNE